jgi:hypothetical protein
MDYTMLRDTRCKLLVMWIEDSGKKFIIHLERSLKMEENASRQINIVEHF